MTSKVQRTLEERVARAAEAALADHNYGSALDILVGSQLAWDLYHTTHSRTSKEIEKIRPVA